MDEEEKTEKPKKQFNVDGFVNGAGKIFSMGEVPNDPVVKVLKRFASWLKYILIIEVVGGFAAFMPYYSYTLIKEGRTDDLAEFLVKAADTLHNEEAEAPDDGREAVARPNAQCTECGSDDAEIWDTTEDVWKWKCKQCGAVFEAE